MFIRAVINPGQEQFLTTERGQDKHKYVLKFNRAKWDEKIRVHRLVRKLGPVENERYSKFVLLKEFDELS
ncbi:hypothetical protein ACTXT7_010499 [Hymenolepis weldensis]